MLNVWCSLWDLKLAIIFSLTSSFTVITLYLFWVSSYWGVLSHMWPFLDSMSLPPSHGCLNDIFQVFDYFDFSVTKCIPLITPLILSLYFIFLYSSCYIFICFSYVCVPFHPLEWKLKGVGISLHFCVSITYTW